MNLNNVQFTQSVSSAIKPVGNRVDVTSRVSAEPVVQSMNTEPQVGSISGVLSAEENLAIATLFPPARGVYNSQAGTQAPRMLPGANLDIQV